MRLADATGAPFVVGWLIETGLYPPLRWMAPSRRDHLFYQQMVNRHLATVNSGQPTAPSSDN